MDQDEEEVQDLKLIDFQVSRFTTPVLDLSYFLGSSTNAELRKQLPDLLLFYYSTLMDEIRFLGHTSPSTLYPYEVFKRHCDSHMKFGFGKRIIYFQGSVITISCI